MTFINPLTPLPPRDTSPINRRAGRRIPSEQSERPDTYVESADAIIDVSADPDAEDSNRQPANQRDGRKAPDSSKDRPASKKRIPPPSADAQPPPPVDFTA